MVSRGFLSGVSIADDDCDDDADDEDDDDDSDDGFRDVDGGGDGSGDSDDDNDVAFADLGFGSEMDVNRSRTRY